MNRSRPLPETAATRLLPAALLLSLHLTGCGMLYEWKDEPYIRPVYLAGEAAAREKAASGSARERDMGYRALAVLAEEARRAGREGEARRLAGLLMECYDRESDPEAQSSLAAVCLRDAGRGDERVCAFLAERLRRGLTPVSCAETLAALRAPGALRDIAAAYDATADYEIKYELLNALWLLGDSAARPYFAKATGEDRAAWPDKIHHMDKTVYMKNLESRLASLPQKK